MAFRTRGECEKFTWLPSGLVNKFPCISKSDAEAEIVHESRLGAANRADIEWGKSFGLGEYSQPQADLPRATQGPHKSNFKIMYLIENGTLRPDVSHVEVGPMSF